jgi:hypothetical protein
MKTKAPIKIHRISYFNWSEFQNDLRGRGWTEQELILLVSDENSNGEMTSVSPGFTLDNKNIFSEEEIDLAQRLIDAGYPRDFNLWVCW